MAEIVTYNKSLYDEFQIRELDMGIDSGIDINAYSNPDYVSLQMRQIRMGLEEDIDVSPFLDKEFDWFQMEEIRLGIREGIDYRCYSSKDIDYMKMRQIRLGLKDGVNLSKFIRFDAGIIQEIRLAVKNKIGIVDYINKGYDVEQLREIRYALEKKLNIEPYLDINYRGPAIREIAIGLEAGIDPKVYSSIKYSWRQMREIRLGIMHRVDIRCYANSLYSYGQMRQIRIGLEDGLDVSEYSSLMFDDKGMEVKRRALVRNNNERKIEEQKAAAKKESLENDAAAKAKTQQETENDVDETSMLETSDSESIENIKCAHVSEVADHIFVIINDNETEAYIEIRDRVEKMPDYDSLLEAINNAGVIQGLRKDVILNLVSGNMTERRYVIAEGKHPVRGKDGYYDYFFDTENVGKTELLADGSMNCKNIKMYDIVSKGQVLAKYNPATAGVDGITVTGHKIKAARGIECHILEGKGFKISKDTKEFISEEEGALIYNDGKIDIAPMLVVNEVTTSTGAVIFDGCVYVKGMVGSGATLKATGDIIIDGLVQGAVIKSGKNILIRNGANGGLDEHEGMIEADGKIASGFLESISVKAHEDIYTNSCMNCNIFADGIVKVHGRKSKVIGGIICAAKGIYVQNVGNSYNIVTTLSIGINSNKANRFNELHSRIIETKNVLEMLETLYNRYKNLYSVEVRNTMPKYLKTEKAIYEKNEELKELDNEYHSIAMTLTALKNASIVVDGFLYEGTVIKMADMMFEPGTVKYAKFNLVNNKIVMSR